MAETTWKTYKRLESVTSPAVAGWFRVSNVGQWQRWDPELHDWADVGKVGADGYSRSIENGDVLVDDATKAEVAALA